MFPILVAIAMIVILLIVVIAGQPDEFNLAREARFSAPPEKIFPHVNDLRAWEAWSPWAKLDPNAKNSFEGPASGVGAAMAWEGNCKIGVGRMTITESKPGELIRFRLEFFKPMQATNIAELAFKSEGNQTVVTWSMSGKNNRISKVMSLFMDCEKMVGPHFEKGLATLKSVSEAGG
ncbi:MAG: polyketide cyclase [Verrucomicrobia bacterium]|nr:MAG: polyketide cyclase [Verrucomicrobiota bacterium]